MSDTLETIEHMSYEGTTKVTYDVEINYDDKEVAETLDIVSVNGLDANYISNTFLGVIKNEIIEDMAADRSEIARTSNGLLYPEYRE